MRTCPDCGAILDKKRSIQQHRRLFAIIHAAHHQWPENHEFKPESSEHLRAWLLCKAGWFTAKYIEAAEGADAKVIAASVEAAFEATDAIAFVRVHGDRVAVYAPKSMEFAAADQRAFAPIAQEIDEIIENALGVPTEQLLKQRAA